jgi:phytoene synthase
MSIQIQAWENTLVDRALEGLQSPAAVHHPLSKPTDPALVAAYQHCAAITHQASKTFFIASGLLPPGKREAARALYAFCRVTDDLVDALEATETRQANLEAWKTIIKAHTPPADNPVAVGWADAQARYHIPRGYTEQLIEGVARDLNQSRYDTFADLASYSYGVASTVGLMAMHIIGYTNTEAIPYAVRLGVALQMTNILRDVGEDWRLGRLYLPLDELAQFGLTEDDIANSNTDARWQAFMDFQIQRTEQLYDESWQGIAMLNPDGRFAIGAAAELYRAILGDIQRHNADVFTRRAHLSALAKLIRLPRIWWRSRTVAQS